MRDEVGQAQAAGTTAAQTAAGYGGNASTISGAMVPQLTRQLSNPSGYSQQDIGSMLSSGLAGSGGATAGLTGAAGKTGMTERNPVGFSAALDSAARSRDQASAKTSEGITAQNAGVKLQQQSQAGDLLSKLYGVNVGGQIGSQGQIANDVKAASDANQTGWLQNMNTTMLDMSQEFKNVAGTVMPGGM